MDRTLNATLCQTFERKPLATLDLPGSNADMTPAQLRALADALRRIADDAEAQPMGHKTYRRKLREYPLATNPT